MADLISTGGLALPVLPELGQEMIWMLALYNATSFGPGALSCLDGARLAM
ncbi:hypothetical protein [Microvirga lotononidis]|nr:hypothetical protein [Microvirga lotononidis]WQO30736.1 hypothetical protein U0023_25265 [Microvirga lotononidis]